MSSRVFISMHLVSFEYINVSQNTAIPNHTAQKNITTKYEIVQRLELQQLQQQLSSSSSSNPANNTVSSEFVSDNRSEFCSTIFLSSSGNLGRTLKVLTRLMVCEYITTIQDSNVPKNFSQKSSQLFFPQHHTRHRQHATYTRNTDTNPIAVSDTGMASTM